MKRFVVLFVAGMFGLTMLGCRAEVDTTGTGTDSHYKKTTKVDDDGTRTTKVETRTDR